MAHHFAPLEVADVLRWHVVEPRKPLQASDRPQGRGFPKLQAGELVVAQEQIRSSLRWQVKIDPDREPVQQSQFRRESRSEQAQ